MTETPLHRRAFLRTAVGVATGSLLTSCSGVASRLSTGPLRLALLTDIHLLPGEPALSGMKRALAHAQAQQPPVDAILNGGDSIMDALESDAGRVEAQWTAFTQTLEQECALPVYSIIGNHDVWGWGSQDASIQQDPAYGKGWAIQALGLPHRYYAFDLGAWRFLALDSTHLPILDTEDPHGDLPYTGRLDDEQFDWLGQQLAQCDPDRPICIFSHIPVLSASEMIDGENESTGNWLVPGAWVHIDARRLVELFHQHPNVRLCLSGHSHQHERLEYLGVTYVSGGAVCGKWWAGDYMHFPPGYVLLRLHRDGSCDSQFVDYNIA